MTDNAVADAVAPGYQFEGPALELGGLMLDETQLSDVHIRIPLAMLNRHGLIAGATGTGKTKTLQLLAEQLSAAGVPVFVSDVKGDLGGLAMPGTPNPRVDERARQTGVTWKPAGVPVDLLSLSGALGAQLRA